MDYPTIFKQSVNMKRLTRQEISELHTLMSVEHIRLYIERDRMYEKIYELDNQIEEFDTILNDILIKYKEIVQ